jgi:predicted TIM-barrel fold metal-dependent hydrolase
MLIAWRHCAPAAGGHWTVPAFDPARPALHRPRPHRARPLLLVGACVVLTACTAGAPRTASHYGEADFAKVPKIDAHVHINGVARAVLAQARTDGFDLVSINVDYPDFPTLADQEAVARELVQVDPVRFHYAASFSMDGWGAPGWAARVNAHLDDSAAHGAVAVKVWKNVGMSVRNADGTLVMIDDPGLDPVLQHVRELGLPLIGHQGEPKNCWLPLEQMTTENDRSYFREHPQYHMYLQPTMPSYEDQMAARDRMLARHRDLRFVGAHMASLEWSVDRLGEFLDANPQAVVDLAARMTQVQYQSQRDRARVRDFFIRYQDRVLYGSDLAYEPGADPATFNAEAHAAWLSDWKYLATDQVQHVDDLDADIAGLQLPRAVIDRIYHDNARRVLLSATR